MSETIHKIHKDSRAIAQHGCSTSAIKALIGSCSGVQKLAGQVELLAIFLNIVDVTAPHPPIKKGSSSITVRLSKILIKD